MKTIIIILISIALGFGLAQLILPASNQADVADNSVTKQQYTCGMHPEIISDEPGYCPICEMKLTPKKEGGSEAGSIVINPTTRQNMGLVTAAAEYRKLTLTLRAFGTVEYSEPKIHTVNLKIDGWVEKLYVDYEGARVEKGRPLVEIYSPELVAAQKEFLIALKSGNSGDMEKLLEGARQRLLNWDISPDQIERLTQTGEVRRNMVIKSPASGVVIAKNVEAGDHLKPGAELYRIADISSVWVVAHVYEQDVPFVALGQTAEISFPNLGEKNTTAEVSYISPFLNARGQTEIRLDVPNPGLMLKPEMYAEVMIKSEMPEASLTLPRSAVINSGARQVVYTASMDGSYAPRIITTGVVGDDDLVEVKSGLNSNEWVVTRGQFLLDSESRLGEALAGGQDQHEHTAFANNNKPAFTATTETHAIYTCPMPIHFDVLQYGEGDCPECGMKLVPVEETDNTEVYVCPMSQCGVVQNESGSCPVCGMDLVKLERIKGDDQ